MTDKCSDLRVRRIARADPYSYHWPKLMASKIKCKIRFNFRAVFWYRCILYIASAQKINIETFIARLRDVAQKFCDKRTTWVSYL